MRTMRAPRDPSSPPSPVRRGICAAALRALTVSALLLLGSACGGESAGPPEGAFELPTLDGRRLGPGDFPGNVVVVDFWATWCAPCHVQAEILETLHRDYGDRGIRFLAVNVGEDEATVRRFVDSRPFPYPVLLDEKESVSTRLRVAALPSLLVLDRDGQVAYFRPGIVQEKRLREILQDAGAPAPAAG